MANIFFSVLIFLGCLEEYSKRYFDSFILSPQNRGLILASATHNKDDQELLSLGPEQAMTSL